MYTYTVQDVERKDDILLLTLAPKNKKLPFEPGQYAAVSFKHGARRTPARCFSIVSTPQNDVLQFAMRVRGGFTSRAARAQRGQKVYVQGPFGDFIINPADDRRIVMLAGGIGVTPFLSMIRDLTDRKVALPITLMYSNRSSASVPFGTALRGMVQQNRYLQVRLFNGDTTGKIHNEHIEQLVGAHDSATTYFICGPKSFSKSMQTMLEQASVHPSRIVSESFAQTGAALVGEGWSIPALTYGLSAAVFALTLGSITVLDLARAVPKLAAAQPKPSPSAQTTANTQTTTTPQPTSSSDSSGSATTSTSPTPTQTTTTTTPAPTTSAPTPAPTPAPSQSYYSYQPPVSQVS